MNLSRFWVIVAVISATVMQSVDMTIVNVALPNMTGELGATPDSISWVLTSYMMAAAVFMPLTGFLTDRFGRKRLLLVSVGGFVVSSGLCGVAETLPEIVIFRTMQGICGGPLAPLSQAFIIDTFPLEERGRAMATWGMGIMLAPILGPTLGGYLTEAFSWRWTFYINLPVGLASLLLAWRYVPDTPTKPRELDWIGFVTLATAIACLQLVLDRGAEKDWFESTMICAATAAALLAFAGFLWKCLACGGQPLFDLRMLKDRNLAVTCLIILATGLGVFGNQMLQPLFLQTQLGFPAIDAGIYVVPRGIATFISMSLVGRYGNHFSPRSMVFMGMLLNVCGALVLTQMTVQAPGSFILFPTILQGLGIGLIFIPLSSLAFVTLPRHLSSEAAGLYGLMRSVGISFGVAITATYLNYSVKLHWADMRGMVTPYSQNIHNLLQHTGQGARAYYDAAGLHLNSHGLALMSKMVSQQATVQAFIDTYWMIAASFFILIPLVLLIKAAAPSKMAPAVSPLE